MLAIFKTGGKQYSVTTGQIVKQQTFDIKFEIHPWGRHTIHATDKKLT